MTSAHDVPLTRQDRIRLTNELTSLRRRPCVEVPDDYIETPESRSRYLARRARIRHIEDVLAQARVDDDLTDDDVAKPGMVLTVRYDDSGGTVTFILGGHGAGDEDNNIYPLRSPIGRAIAGARPGEKRTLRLLTSPAIAVTLLSVRPAVSRGARRCRSRRHGRADSASSARSSRSDVA
ncbi:GreA/GreB family elongation factor [Mycobacterium barrassiae]|uniref:GreA/GreB family elongation factor n=1 Tax=Mycobacterium barrassiae TaxID=319709 RepID=UPI002265E340|nr:GreA/GreB family elongation factor [Mycobacterium barrassiae]MCV7302938.1 GreA/GreB family elongation factor [Mycobacterium barrassiae]